MSWCLQCGAKGRPTRAAGVDEDGEPACVGHAVKELGIGLNAAAGRAPAVPAPIQQPAAAPSPVQTKAEDEMEDRICKGYNRVCDRKIGEKCETGLCSRCYANQKYHASRPRKAVKPRKVKTEPPQIDLDRTPQDMANVREASDPFIVVRLRSSHVGRLLGLLLQ